MLHIMWDWSFIQCENLSIGNRWVRHGKHRCILLLVQRRKPEVVDKLGILVHLPNMWRDNTGNTLLPRLVWLVLREQRLFHELCRLWHLEDMVFVELERVQRRMRWRYTNRDSLVLRRMWFMLWKLCKDDWLYGAR